MPTSGTFFIEISGVFWWGKVLGIMNAMTKFKIGIYFYFCGLNGWANRWADGPVSQGHNYLYWGVENNVRKFSI